MRATSGLPELISEGRDIGMPERGDPMTEGRNPGRMLTGFRGVLVGLPRLFVSSQVILFSVLFGNTMGVRADVVQLGGLRMILVMGSVVIASRHNYKVTIRPDLAWASFASLKA